MSEIYVYLSPTKEVTMWVKAHIWHKWTVGKNQKVVHIDHKVVDHFRYPCWWGMHSEPPEEHGYTYVGRIA